MATHTPEPWRVERGTAVAGVGEEWEVTADDGAIVIAQPPTEADARIIKAAPKMLRALRAMFLPGSGAAMHAECWDLVREAITEATAVSDGGAAVWSDDEEEAESCPHCDDTGWQGDGTMAIPCPECSPA